MHVLLLLSIVDGPATRIIIIPISIRVYVTVTLAKWKPKGTTHLHNSTFPHRTCPEENVNELFFFFFFDHHTYFYTTEQNNCVSGI